MKYEDKTNKYPILIGGEDWAIYQQYINFSGKAIWLNRWRTWGEWFEPFQIYYQNIDGVLIFFDTTNKNSFENIVKWYEKVKEKAGKKVNIMMIGTKSDLINKRAITYEEGKRLADKIGFLYLEISSTFNRNIKIAIDMMAASIDIKKIDLH